MVASYALELFPVSKDAWDLYEKKFHELFKRTSTLKNGTIIFYNDKNDNAGIDLYTNVDTVVEKPVVIDLGVRARMFALYDDHHVDYNHYWMPPRSSIWKNGITLANSIGVIDVSYRGNLMAAVLPIRTDTIPLIDRGTRLVQIIAPDMGHIAEIGLCPLPLLDKTERGEGGFGSTGK